ncbi:putative adenylyl cyclase CyaB [Clostridiales bacterium KA00134]|nr:putative adenylyl cyclase CyaB [Clostridiales bacterium KA00134]
MNNPSGDYFFGGNMEREIEVKILNTELEKIEDKIKKDALFLLEEEQVNILIESQNYKDYRKYGDLRIRHTRDTNTREEKNYLTFKERLSTEGARESLEHTTEISDIDECLKILALLGYEDVKYLKKHRKSYIYKGLRFDLDRWEEGLAYCEIEGSSRNEIEKILDELEIDKNNISTKSIRELKREGENKK